MKRDKLFMLVAIAAVIIIICVLVCGSLSIERIEEKPYILGRGETLWEVYEEYGSGIKWQKWLYEMETINCKRGNEPWYAGESITIIVTK